jgi:hypothetical protein
MNRTMLTASIGAAVAGLVIGQTAVASSPPPLAKDRVRLTSMVLRAADVPAGFMLVFSHGYTPAQIAAQGTWTASQLKNWKYEAGYEVQFDRGADGSDPAQISSDAGAYRTAAGARRALSANGTACQQGLWRELSLDEPVGTAAHLCTLTTTLRGYQVQVFFVVWTVGRFKGAIALTGLHGQVSAGDAVALARIQATRMGGGP